MNSVELREKRGQLVKELQSLVTKAKEEKRSLTGEEQQIFDRIDGEQERLKTEIDGLERIEKFDGMSLEESRQQIRSQSRKPEPIIKTEDRKKALSGWFTFGSPSCKREWREAADKMGVNLASPYIRVPLLKNAPKQEETRENIRAKVEERAQTVGTLTAGGDLVATDIQLMSEVEVALKYYGGMLQTARVLRTETGANLPIPTTDDVANAGVIIGEGSSITEVDETFGQIILNAYKLTSGTVQVSWELAQDAAVDLPEFLGQRLGIRLGRGINNYFTNGTGSGGSPAQPRGFILDATSGATSQTAGGTTLVYADLVNLQMALDPAYWEGARWQFNSNTMKKLKLLVDGNGRPLWQPGLQGFAEKNEDTILGFPFTLNQDMPNMGSSVVGPLAFGRFDKYLARIVAGDDSGVELIRLNERYADVGMIAFIAFVRIDGRLIDAGTHPIQVLTCDY